MIIAQTFISYFSWGAFTFNVISSIVASVIFIFFLLFALKPKFTIVPLIAKNDSPFDDTDEISYSFKVINKSIFDAYDVEARLNSFKITQGENGIVNKIYTKIELKTSKVNHIPRNILFNPKYANNCVQFFTYSDLSELMKKNDIHIQFQITAKHSLSGLSNIFTYEYVTKGTIIEGKFKEGNNRNVIDC